MHLIYHFFSLNSAPGGQVFWLILLTIVVPELMFTWVNIWLIGHHPHFIDEQLEQGEVKEPVCPSSVQKEKSWAWNTDLSHTQVPCS